MRRPDSPPLSPETVQLGRRSLLLTLAALPAACVNVLPEPRSVPLSPPATPPQVRPPKVGQEWSYNVRNVYNRDLVDTLVERVVEVGDKVRIQRLSGRHGTLPEEIQAPWGSILQDPHWSPSMRYSEALPLWPQELRPGWTRHRRVKYADPAQPETQRDWSLNMSADEWDELATPAGKFKAFKYTNFIQFDPIEPVYSFAHERWESIWLVPEIGRWALRRSTGHYLIEDRGGEIREEYLEWELLSWK